MATHNFVAIFDPPFPDIESHFRFIHLMSTHLPNRFSGKVRWLRRRWAFVFSVFFFSILLAVGGN